MPSPFAEELVKLLPRLRGFALSLTGSSHEADDLVQAACERALRAWQQWIPGTRLDSWVFRIMRNHWIDGIRKRKAEGDPHSLEELPEVGADDGNHVAETALTLDAVRGAIAKLPEDQRQVLLAVCAEERSYQDTADLLGIPIGTVMSRLARARGRLAAALGLGEASRATTVDEMRAAL
jgi:RNA polymerase sigma-70 factor (ECF subfamily)